MAEKKSKGLFLVIMVILSCFFQLSCSTSNGIENQNIQADQLEVKVMTFNIRYYGAKDGPDNWQYRRQMVINVIKNNRVDIIGFQEAHKLQVEQIQEQHFGFQIHLKCRGQLDGEIRAADFVHGRDLLRKRVENAFIFSIHTLTTVHSIPENEVRYL